MVEQHNKKNIVHHFRGRSVHTLDNKGRLNIATRFREVLRGQYDNDMLMVTPWHNCLRAYPLSQWEELETTLRTEGRKKPDMISMVRYMIGGVVESSLDKQGRISLSSQLREDCGIKKEVVVNGMITYLEIWDKETWEVVSKPSPANFQTFEQTLLELGLF